MYRRAHEGRACIFCYQQTKRAKIFGSITKFGYLCLDE
jgi:hypothetical protein